ncbi:MAG: hypothetical protein LIO40_06110 [Ruminococcus sp.]|nr:hypothetical protein [Ruminococcus sp.]
MQEFRVFRVSYDMGQMDLNVGTFFGTIAKKKVEKALRLIRKNCWESDRIQLIDDLRYEYEIRGELLSETEGMLAEGITQKALKRQKETLQKSLKRQRERLEMWAKLLEQEQW